MDEERLKRIRANIAKHEERKKTQNIMGDIDSSKLDRSNTSYNKNDAAFEMAKQHYQNSYVPKKAQEYYKGVENYRNSYEQMANKPSANNYTVMTPENESANLISDGINTYVSPQMREKAQKHYNEVFNNENKKYAEQYARLNEKSKPAYSYAQAKSKAAKEVDNSINAFSSQFKDENEYNAYADNMAQAKEQQRLLNYNVAEAKNKLLTMKALNMNPSVKVEDTDEYKRIESDMKKAESVQEFAKNMQNEDFRKQYAEYEQHQKDYENKNWFGKAAEQVGDAIAGSIYNTGEGMYTAFIEPVTNAADYFIGRNPYEEGTLSNKIHSFYNYVHDEADRRERFSGYAQQGLTTDLYNATNNEEFSKFTSGVITTTLDAVAEAGLSMAVAALSGGTSLAAKGIQTAVGLTKAQKVAQTASSMLKGMMKDLNFWISFAKEGGGAYNDAIDAGASNEEATIAMLATGLPNAYIEVGGGVEKFKELAGTGVKGWLRDFAKSTGEEATEELKQGIISELVKKLTYAPETELFSTADDGSGIINPIRMYQEAFGGAVGGAFGGSVGKAINVASYTVANNMYKSDSMRELIQSGKYTEMLKALPDSDFKNSEISKTFSAEMDEKQTLAKLKGISNRQLIKQYDSMVDTLSSVSEGNVASLALIATGNTKTATEVAPILRKLYDGKAITEEEAKIISRNENVVNMLSETTGLDMTNSSWEDFVTLSEQAQFENITGTSTGNAIADVVLGNAQRAEAGRNYIAIEQNKYANDLSGTPTFTAQIGDESVKITGIDHVENGEVYVNLSNGTTQEAQSLNTDEVTTALLSYASEYDTETASAFIGGYSGNISVGEYVRSFAGVNSAARTGLSYENIAKTAQTMVNNIGESTAKYLAETGNVVAQEQKVKYDEELKNLQSRQAKRLDKASVKNETNGTATKAHKRLARTISKITGYTVTLVDSTNGYNNKQNGRTAIGSINSTKGEIVLDIGSDDVVATTLHEVTHYIKLNAPTQYNALRDAVIEYATKTGKIEYYLEKYSNTYRTNNVHEITEEMTADAAEALLTNEKFIDELFSDKDFINAVVGNNKGFVRKFLDTLHDIINSIKDYLKGRTVNHQIARELSEDVKALEKIEKLWRDALKAAVDNHAESSVVKQDTKKSAEESGNKFALSENETKYDYKSLIAKDDIVIASDVNADVPYTDGRINRKEIVKQALNNVSTNNENRFIYNKDLNKYVKITRKGIEHGLTRKGENNALAAILIKNYLPNAICVNELRARENLTNSYVLLGAFQNNNKFYCVRIVVNENKNAYAVKDIDVLYAINAKEIEPVATKRRGLGVETYSTSTGSKISIADFLNNVKNYYSDVLSDNVISHLQISRKPSPLSDSIKFSISEQTSAEYELLKQENSDLKTQVEALKNEMKLTGGHVVDTETLNKLAHRYIKEYKSKADFGEVSAKLKQIFDYVATEDANAEEANKAMYELASQMINKSETLNTEMRDTYKDVLDIIRSAKIYVDDATKSEIESLYGDYNTFRKSMFGRMKLTTNKESHGKTQTVDMLVQELAELAPGQFDTNVSEGECLEQLVSFIEATKPRIENPFGDSVAEAASELAWQMFDDYFDTPEVKTFADKYEAKLQKVINENRIARAELRKAERTKAKAFYDAKLKALRDAKNQKLSDVRADRDAKLKALREYYKEQQESKRERAAENELRARITVEYKKLYRDLMTNSKEHHIPEVYKETVAGVLASIDLISKVSKEKATKTGEITKTVEKLNNQLTALENFVLNYSMYGNKDDGTSSEQLYNFDPDLVSNIQKIKEYFKRYANSGTKAISDMNIEELEALHNTLKALRYAVKTADKALSASITLKISTLAEKSIAEMATDKTRNPFSKNKAAQVVGAVDTYINSQMLDARSYYRGMGNSAFEIYKAFRSGLNSFIKHTHEAQDYFAKVRKDSGYTDKQIKHLVDDYETYNISHGEIAMSKAQLMSLYCLSKREQALEHIYKGGIRPTDLKGKRQIRPVMISPDELSSLLKNLNSTEIAMADRLQQFMATTCAEWGNEVSMAMYGYAKFTERNYFPIKSSDTKIRTNDQNSGGDTGLYSVLNYGMTKSLVKNANNSIDVGDIFSVTRQHIEEMSSYSAYAVAVADSMRWFNYNNRETGESVKQSMLNKFGTNGSKYFIELVRDINRNKPTGNYGGEISSVLTSAQKAAAIAGNLSVVVQQPTAIARACTELSLDLIAEGIAISATHIKKSAQEAQAHSEIAWWKSQGFFETNMSKSMDEIITGRSTAKDKLVEMAMKPAGLADDVTWGAIWEATKLWTKKYHPEVKVNSEEFYSITKEKFDDVVDQTQVVDSVLHRPMILRSKNALVKMDMSFMAEPLKSANLLRNAIVDVKNKKPNATKKLIRVYASCVMANVLAAAAKAIVMAFRDTGDDEWWEKWFSSFSSDLLSTLNPLSIIPFVKDIFSVLDGYDVERMDMSAVTGIIQFVQQAVEYAQKDNLDKALNLQSAYKLTRYLSQLTGLPVYNVLREIDTIIDIFGEPIFRASHATPNTERYEALYNAVMKNDEAEMQNEYDRLGKTQKEIEQRLKSKIIDDSKGNKMFNEDVDKAAKARISGDVKTAVEIVRNLADTTALSKDFWTACVNARANKISKAQENRTRLIEAGISKLTVDNMSDTEVNEALKSYEAEVDTSTANDLNEDTNTESLYTADDLVKALQNGNKSDYNTAYDDMVSAKAVSLIMQAEADNKELTADEAEEKAESSIKSEITKVLKPLMRELYKTDKKKFNEMRKKIIKKFGYTSKQITKWLTSEE